MHKKQISRPWLGVVEGVAMAVGASFVGILLFALLVKSLGLADQIIPIVNQIIKVISIALGTFVAVRAGTRGMLGGLLVGLLYMTLGMTMYMLLEGRMSPMGTILGDLLLGGALGGVSGVLLANILKR